MSKSSPMVFLVDVDDTLLDNPLDPIVLASYPAADVTAERISDLLSYDLLDLVPGRPLAARPASVV